MKEIAIITGIVVVATLLMVLSIPQIEDVNISKIEIKSLSTNKDTYFSREIMTINLLVHSRIEADASIEISGIGNRLKLSRSDHLNIGDNNLTFQYEMPSCYGCAGISPGNYNFTAYVTYDNTTIESPVHWIELKK